MKKQLIILGGGTSVTEGINKGLFSKLENKFLIGTNFSHHFIKDTCLMFIDDTFHKKQLNYLEKLPLAIGALHTNVPIRPNIIELKRSPIEYHRDCKNGVYGNLTGEFALNLAIYLLDDGEIFLLGFDNGAKKDKGKNLKDSQGRALSHWYQYGDIVSRYTGKPLTLKHRGIGKINWYQATQLDQKTNKRISRVEHEYRVFKNETKVKIYNVSMESIIPTFEKITYDEFFKKLNNQNYNQDELREEIKKKLAILPKNYKR